jgi:hypothetical protein
VVSRVVRAVSGLVGVVLWTATTPAYSQSNLDAGKSAQQIFAATCSNCHRSAREIKRTTTSFLREHYTTGSQEAATMAAYLAGIGSDPKAIEQRRRPAMGAGQGSSEAAAKPNQGGEQAALSNQNGRQSSTDQAKSSQAGLGRPRRPADSMEAGVPLAAMAAAPGAGGAAAAVAMPAAVSPADIEE